MATEIKFDLFSQLPEELRLIIWSLSLTPQLISFRCHLSNFSPQYAPPFLYLLGGDPPYTHFTANDQVRPAEPYFTAFSYPSESSSPSVLSTCRESRFVALSGGGYKAWRVGNKEGKIRDLMWNPAIDVIYFPNQNCRNYFQGEIELFGRQFLEQAKEIQKIAVLSSLWTPYPGRIIGLTSWEMRGFSKLGELIVVLDEEFERGYVLDEPKNGQRYTQEAWNIPRDIQKSLTPIKEDFTESSETGGEPSERGDWRAPEVRVVAIEEGILRGDSCEMRLRCFPCVDLGLD
jgi:hypothetical protein